MLVSKRNCRQQAQPGSLPDHGGLHEQTFGALDPRRAVQGAERHAAFHRAGLDQYRGARFCELADLAAGIPRPDMPSKPFGPPTPWQIFEKNRYPFLTGAKTITL